MQTAGFCLRRRLGGTPPSEEIHFVAACRKRNDLKFNSPNCAAIFEIEAYGPQSPLRQPPNGGANRCPVFGTLQKETKLMQHLQGIVPLALALQLAPLAAAAQSGYTITDLGSPAGAASSYAAGVNNSGQIVGRYDTAYGYAAFVYSNGKMTDLGNIDIYGDPYHTTAAASSVNDSGQIVGAFTYRAPDPVNGVSAFGAFLYENGQMRPIGGQYNHAESGLQSAQAINNTGQVVGYDLYGKAALYQNGVTIELNLQAKTTRANAINNQGMIVGNDGTGAFSYQNDVEQILPALDPAINYGSEALGINDSGKVVGYSGASDRFSHATLWQNGVPYDLGSFGRGSVAYDINNSDMVVGYANLPNGQITAFIYQNGQMTDLLAGTLWHNGAAESINDSGQIVGWAISPSGAIHAFLATPNAVPEPGALACGVAAGVLLLAARRKRRATP